MAEFASATLLGALQLALAAEGIQVDLPRQGGALAPMSLKRQLVTAIASEHGLLPLARAGRVIASLPPDPVISALIAARSPADLFDRWSRLARFAHSHHRVELRAIGHDHITAEHVGPVWKPPIPAEDMLILGVLTALLQAIGARDVTVAVDRRDPVVVFRADTWMPPPSHRDIRFWRFAWSSLHPAPATPPCTAGPLDARVRALIDADPGRRWLLCDVARALQTSSRSLQRGLRSHGGFGTILARSRASAAAALLRQTDHSPGLIGFACGYADQPHFSREFKRWTAMTPTEYRAACADRTVSSLS